MATITVNPSDVTVSSGTFSTSGSGSISWTAPTIPSGATVTSCVLTGKATASSTSVKTIKVNNQSVSVSTSGASFSIDLSDSVVTQSVPVAIEDNSWSNTNVKFTNMVYTIVYERKSTGTTNNIHIGDFNIKTIYLGDTPIAAAYLGDKKLL